MNGDSRHAERTAEILVELYGAGAFDFAQVTGFGPRCNSLDCHRNGTPVAYTRCSTGEVKYRDLACSALDLKHIKVKERRVPYSINCADPSVEIHAHIARLKKRWLAKHESRWSLRSPAAEGVLAGQSTLCDPR